MADNRIISIAADIAMHNLSIAFAKKLPLTRRRVPKEQEILQRQALASQSRDRNAAVISTVLSRFLAEPSPRSASRPGEASGALPPAWLD